MNSIPCRLCRANATWVCQQRLLARHDVDYFLCSHCELLQTQQPHWLDEAYASALSRLDTGALRRNQTESRQTALLAAALGIAADEPCLDYGGGYGVLTRMMRDVGLDFRWWDKHAENLFARGFGGDVQRSCRLVTAFEVLEHFADVHQDLEQLFGPRHDFVFIATVLHDGHRPGWWYYLLESGQHVAFYARRTMRFIADTFGYDEMAGPTHTLFARKGALRGARRALVQGLVRQPFAGRVSGLLPEPLLRRIGGYRPRTDADHDLLRGASA